MKFQDLGDDAITESIGDGDQHQIKGVQLTWLTTFISNVRLIGRLV